MCAYRGPGRVHGASRHRATRTRAGAMKVVVALLCAMCAAAGTDTGDKSPSKQDNDDQAGAAPQLQYVSWG